MTGGLRPNIERIKVFLLPKPRLEVLQCDPPGSTGHGSEHAAANVCGGERERPLVALGKSHGADSLTLRAKSADRANQQRRATKHRGHGAAEPALSQCPSHARRKRCTAARTSSRAALLLLSAGVHSLSAGQAGARRCVVALAILARAVSPPREGARVLGLGPSPAALSLTNHPIRPTKPSPFPSKSSTTPIKQFTPPRYFACRRRALSFEPHNANIRARFWSQTRRAARRQWQGHLSSPDAPRPASESHVSAPLS